MTQIFFFSHVNLKTLSETMNSELTKVSSWLLANELSLNIKKTQVVIFKAKIRMSMNLSN